MDSLLTSANRIRLLDRDGVPVADPVEWEPGLVELLVDPAEWAEGALTLQGAPLPVSLRRLGGVIRVLADWPRAGPGRYRLRFETSDEVDELVAEVRPRKISEAAFVALLEDLEARLPAVVAIGLQRGGALAGIALPPPGETTLAQEFQRLRRAVNGISGRPGLATVLEELADDPHEVLRGIETWVRQERARRPHPGRLAQAVAVPGNLGAGGLPIRVFDARVEASADVYENRLLASFHEQVHLRLRRLAAALAATRQLDAFADAHALLDRLVRARRAAAFLDGVAPLAHPAARTTMVLLRRPPYRAALEGYLEFHRTVAVRLEAPGLEAPLENLPALYQTWGTLEVVAALLAVAPGVGYRVVAQRLAVRDAGGLYVRVLPDGRPAVVLARDGDGTVVRLIPERSYGSQGLLRSVSYLQRPDVAVEVERPGEPVTVFLFDPKYKLDGGATAAEPDEGRPTKADIDKMHAYRDAIRDAAERRAVKLAAVLYPGPAVRYAPGLEALPAVPGDPLGRLGELLEAAIA